MKKLLVLSAAIFAAFSVAAIAADGETAAPAKGMKSYQKAARSRAADQAQAAAQQDQAEQDVTAIEPAAGADDEAEKEEAMHKEMRLPRKN